MLREEILGFDTIFHVVRMGRLEENDKKLPRLVFETLMTPKSDREELLKRYRLLVTHCDSSDDDGISAVEAMAQFRGQLIETLPEEFRDVDIIFVKNNARCKSDYNGARRIRREIVHGHLVPCRENRSVVYVPPRLSDILEDEAKLRENMEQTMGCTALRKLDLADVLATEHFFRFVVKSGKWQEPRGTGLPAWKALHIAGRDRIAVEFAENCLPILQLKSKPLLLNAQRGSVYGRLARMASACQLS
jgi:hypothetical protein